MIYEFAATQDLHGYGKPWAPGTEKNKLKPPAAGATINGVTFTVGSDGVVTANGTATAVADFYFVGGVGVYEDPEIPVGTYYLTGNSLAGTSSVFYVIKQTGGGTTVASQSGGAGNISFSIEENENYRIFIRVLSGVTVTNQKYYPMIRPTSESDASYTPYANVCMPEGFNIWDPDNDEFVQVYAGYVNANTQELYLRPVYEEYAGEELVGPWMSSLDPYSEDATPTEGAFVIDFGGELTEYEITPFMLQTLLDSLGIRQHFMDGASLLNSLMDQAQGRVRSEEELLNRSLPLKVIAIGDQLPTGLTFKPISKDVLPGLPGKFIR